MAFRPKPRLVSPPPPRPPHHKQQTRPRPSRQPRSPARVAARQRALSPLSSLSLTTGTPSLLTPTARAHAAVSPLPASFFLGAQSSRTRSRGDPISVSSGFLSSARNQDPIKPLEMPACCFSLLAAEIEPYSPRLSCFGSRRGRTRPPPRRELSARSQAETIP